jgi:hypothetical protein
MIKAISTQYRDMIRPATLKHAKKTGVVNADWEGCFVTKENLRCYLMDDHKIYVNVHLDTTQQEFPRWSYRIDFINGASKISSHWMPYHIHTEKSFKKYHQAFEAGLVRALEYISNPSLKKRIPSKCI